MLKFEMIEELQKKLTKKLSGKTPKIAITLGSGLGGILNEAEILERIPYESLGVPLPTAKGHKGELVLARICGKSVVFLSGRVHLYEGYSQEDVVFLTAGLGLAGVETFIFTNATGALNEGLEVGDVLMIKDHINLGGENPLIGTFDPRFGGERFTDSHDIYTKHLRSKMNMQEGIYAFRYGPIYETPAEINMLRVLGADCVAMSLIPESVMAAHMKKQVMAFSLIVNKCDATELTHEEVLQNAKKSSENFIKIIKRAVEVI